MPRIISQRGNEEGSFAGAIYALELDSVVTLNKTTPSDGAAGDAFGRGAEADNGTVVVGAPGDDDNGSDAGSAYIFSYDSSGWTQQTKLTAGDGAANDYYGLKVDIDGDTAVIGAIGHNVGGAAGAGTVYVYTGSGISWTLQTTLTASDGAAGDLFGFGVAIDGDTIVVGARDHDTGGNTDAGAAYVFTRSGSTWSQQAKLTASDAASYDYFGVNLAIDGDSVIVGASDHYVSSMAQAGQAYVFTRSGSTWTQQAILTATDAAAYDYFGLDVDISGDRALVGAPGDDDDGSGSGSAYTFTRSGSSWTQDTKLTASDGTVDADFGFRVDLS